jgi:hypothetical protein
VGFADGVEGGFGLGLEVGEAVAGFFDGLGVEDVFGRGRFGGDASEESGLGGHGAAQRGDLGRHAGHLREHVAARAGGAAERVAALFVQAGVIALVRIGILAFVRPIVMAAAGGAELDRRVVDAVDAVEMGATCGRDRPGCCGRRILQNS